MLVKATITILLTTIHENDTKIVLLEKIIKKKIMRLSYKKKKNKYANLVTERERVECCTRHWMLSSSLCCIINVGT